MATSDWSGEMSAASTASNSSPTCVMRLPVVTSKSTTCPLLAETPPPTMSVPLFEEVDVLIRELALALGQLGVFEVGDDLVQQARIRIAGTGDGAAVSPREGRLIGAEVEAGLFLVGVVAGRAFVAEDGEEVV